jgi:TPP-dependent pyruvate/acetoin dehydrogenase alpha subunit
MLAAETFRMGGHATHDEREAREVIPPEMFVAWGRRDPIGQYEEHLKQSGTTGEELAQIEAEVADEVQRAADEALRSREGNMPEPASALEGVYAPPAA